MEASLEALVEDMVARVEDMEGQVGALPSVEDPAVEVQAVGGSAVEDLAVEDPVVGEVEDMEDQVGEEAVEDMGDPVEVEDMVEVGDPKPKVGGRGRM